MKVYLGPYHHWFQPYSWVKNWIMWWYGFGSEKFDVEKYDLLTKWIRERFSWLNWLEGKVDSWHTRRIKVRVDYYDVWRADHTLGLVILPVLKLLREKKQGSPFVDDEDVPEHLRSTSAEPLTEEQVNMGYADNNLHLRWRWALDEMIWSMEQVVNEDSDDEFFTHHEDVPSSDFLGHKVDFDKDGYNKWQARKNHGLMLFGKYYESLWD